MIKLVVELSEGYVHEKADSNNLKKENNPLVLMVRHLVFTSLEARIKDQSEFLISSQDLKDSKELQLFDDAVTYLCGILLGKGTEVHDTNQSP